MQCFYRALDYYLEMWYSQIDHPEVTSLHAFAVSNSSYSY